MESKRRRPQEKARVEQWMTRAPYTVEPNDSVTRAIMLIEEQRINQLPVVADGRLVGVITDRDLRDAWTLAPGATKKRRQHTGTLDSDEIPVSALMTRAVLTVNPGDAVEKAAELMRARRIGALPVMAQNHLEGIITRSDILDAFLRRKRPNPGMRTTPSAKTSSTRYGRGHGERSDRHQ